jgi:hypothetical protein
VYLPSGLSDYQMTDEPAWEQCTTRNNIRVCPILRSNRSETAWRACSDAALGEVIFGAKVSEIILLPAEP